MTSSKTALELTRQLLRLNSINPPGREQACADVVAKLLEDAGFSVSAYEFANGRTNLVACLPGRSDRPTIAFTGHLDTVPLGTAPWTYDPFAGEIANGRLYGRGSSDMKSGIAAAVVAAIRCAAVVRHASGLCLVLTAGEETGCEGARQLVGLQGALPPVGALIIAEPTSNYPCIGHKGALWLRASMRGITAHGSTPGEGQNAIYKSARAVLRLESHRFTQDPHPYLGKPTLNVGTICGGLNINSVPDLTEVEIDIRSVPGQSHDRILQCVATVLGADADVTPIMDLGGIASDPNDPWVQAVFDIVGQSLNRTIEPRGVPYFTDGSILTPAWSNIPTVILGPGETVMAHKTDEYCDVTKIEQAVEIYSDIITRSINLLP